MHEKEIIRKFFAPLANNKESYGLKNDAALINQNLVVSTDMMVEDYHFKKNDDPEKLAQKLIRINLSDLAAMGSKPYGYVLNIGIPNNELTWIKRFSDGLKKDSKKFKLKLFGGDLSKSKKIFLSLTIFGKKKEKVHLENKAEVGSEIFVTGNIGDAAIGYNLFYNHKKINCSKSLKSYFTNKFFLPEPRIKFGQDLLGRVDFCTDISDGLYEELLCVSENSNLQAVIFLDSIPFSIEAKKILKKNNKTKMLNIMLGGGEDYELLFSSSKPFNSLKLNKDYIKIGYFDKGNGVKFVDSNHKNIPINIKSFSHF